MVNGFLFVQRHRPYLVVKFIIPKLSYRMRILHTYAWSIKSRRNKKLIV